MGFVCFVQVVSVHMFVQFHYATTKHCPMETVGNCRNCGDIIYCVSEMCRERSLLRINHSDNEGVP